MSEKSNKKIDRRVFPRFEYLECAMIYAPNLADPIRTMVVDIGIGGLQLRSKEGVPVGELLEVHIGRDENPPLRVKGYARFSQLIDDGENLYVTGFKFSPRTHEERAAIAQYVHDVFTRQWNIMAG